MNLRDRWNAFSGSNNGFGQTDWMPQLAQYRDGYSPFSMDAVGSQLFGDSSGMPAANQTFNTPQFSLDIGSGAPQTGLAAAWGKFQDSSFKDQASAIGATVGALANGYQAYNSVKTAKGQLAFAKDSWNKNFEAQRKTTNASLADRQAARVASNPNGYQSVDSYMKKYGI